MIRENLNLYISLERNDGYTPVYNIINAINRIGITHILSAAALRGIKNDQ